MEKKTTRKPFDWQRFLISVMGTAIGVALTFVVNGMLERRNKEQAQRLTAIMVIHDIDESIDILKSMAEPEEERGKLLEFALEHRDNLGKMPYDSLTSIIYALLESSDFRFDDSKEKVFNSDLDTWQNLGNMKFIDNVQSFFYNRQSFQEWYNSDDLWRRPVSRDEYMQLFMGEGWLTEERVCEILHPFLKEKLHDRRVTYYIDVASYRLREFNRKIEEWTDLNEDNKFLMGITDRELEDYINSMVAEGNRVTKRNLTGNWTLAMGKNSYSNYSFGPGNSFSVESVLLDEGHWENWSGTLKAISTYSGVWEVKGDSLILTPGPSTAGDVKVEVDGSGLVPVEGRRDSLDSWLDEYRQFSLEECRKNSEARHAFHSRMDSSHDKMKWTDSAGDVSYLKRQEE